MSYPVAWLDETFSSRQRAETLLRPDLDAGLITEHDFRLATTFLPGHHRYWPIVFGGTGSVVPTLLARIRGRPWGAGRTFILSSIGLIAGTFLGELSRARAHFQFAQSLENPRGFAQALQNVNVRTGGKQPLSWTLPQLKEPPTAAVSTQDIHGDTANPDESASDSVWAPDAPQTMPTPMPTSSDAAPQSQVPAAASSPSPSGNTRKPASKWDEIRAANAAGARQSSWDAIRQGHERAAAGDAVQPTSITSEFNQKDRERADEQARFDAILEAERRLAGRDV